MKIEINPAQKLQILTDQKNVKHSNIWIHADYTAATNGKAIAIIPRQMDSGAAGFTPYPIPKKAYAAATKGKSDAEIEISDNRETFTVSKDGAETKHVNTDVNRDLGEGWDPLAVIPDPDAPCAIEVVLNAKMLLDLAKALGSENHHVRLRIPVLNTAIRVDVADGVAREQTPYGAIMPVFDRGA